MENITFNKCIDLQGINTSIIENLYKHNNLKTNVNIEHLCEDLICVST